MDSVFLFAAIEIIRKLITIVGNVTLKESLTWLEVKANAEALREEGHDVEPTPPEKPNGQ